MTIVASPEQFEIVKAAILNIASTIDAWVKADGCSILRTNDWDLMQVLGTKRNPKPKVFDHPDRTPRHFRCAIMHKSGVVFNIYIGIFEREYCCLDRGWVKEEVPTLSMHIDSARRYEEISEIYDIGPFMGKWYSRLVAINAMLPKSWRSE